MPTFYPENNRVLPSDDSNRTLHKIAALVASGGGGGSGTQQVYMDRAPAAPDDPTKPALSFPSGGGSIQQWDNVALAWF